MPYFKYVNLDNWQELSIALNVHIAKLQNFDRNAPTSEWLDLTIFDAIPLIQKTFSNINLTVERAGFFYLPPLSMSSIHRDACARGFCRINIPVLNCENSITRFYKSSSNKTTIMKQNNGREYYAVDESDCRVVSLVEIIKPTVLDVSEIHQVENYNSVPRIAATFAFKEDIRYLLD